MIFSLVVLLAGTVCAEKICTFEDVLRPEMMDVFGDHVYIMEGATVFDYSLKEPKLLRKFGKKGEGPGELKVVTLFSNTVSTFSDYVLAESIDKLVYFSKEGALIEEKKKSQRSFRFMPLGKNFVGIKLAPDKAGKLYLTLTLFNSKTETEKELHKQLFFQQGNNIQLIPESLNFGVCDDKIFIEKSDKGFLIEVLDSTGEKLYQVEKKCERLKVTDESKKKIYDKLKEEPRVKEQGWENIKKIINFTFADSFPPIQDIVVDNKKIYVKTFKEKKDKVEFIIMDLKGKIQKRVYLPEIRNRYLVYLAGYGPKFYSIHNNKYYYMKENEKTEAWELYVIDIAAL